MNYITHRLLSRLAIYLCEKTGTYPAPPKVKRQTRSYQMERGARIPGICEDAETLGVSRVHLWRVLNGKRKSESLSRRYRDLQKQKNQEVTS